MLSIRLKRIGKKKKPFYNIIISDKSKYINGKYIEKLGHFNPFDNKTYVNLQRINYWIKNGALLSNRVQSIIKKIK